MYQFFYFLKEKWMQAQLFPTGIYNLVSFLNIKHKTLKN